MAEPSATLSSGSSGGTGAKAGAKPPQGTAGAKSKKGDGSRKEQRRIEAENRNRNNAQLKPLRKAAKSVERKWEKAEAKVVDIATQLAEPEVYEDPERLTELTKAHHEAKDAAAELFVEWERATEKLERAEAG